MRIVWRMLYFGLILSVACLMVENIWGISPAGSQENIDMKDPDELVESYEYTGSTTMIGDFYTGLKWLWDINVPFIENFLAFAINAGCPITIVNPFKAIWRFLWISFIIEFASGRHFIYD